jgi:hypothetical protein
MGYSECPTSGAFRPRQTLAVDRAHKERPKYSHWTREWGNLVFFKQRRPEKALAALAAAKVPNSLRELG